MGSATFKQGAEMIFIVCDILKYILNSFEWTISSVDMVENQKDAIAVQSLWR